MKFIVSDVSNLNLFYKYVEWVEIENEKWHEMVFDEFFVNATLQLETREHRSCMYAKQIMINYIFEEDTVSVCRMLLSISQKEPD
jgi:hypothetical protein